MEDIKVMLESSTKDELRFIAFDEPEGFLGEMRISILPEDFLIQGFFIPEEYRRHGVATALLNYFIDTIPETLIRPMQMVFNLQEEGGKDLYAFFEQRDDFILSEEMTRYIISTKDFAKAIYDNREQLLPEKIKAKKICDLSDAEKKNLKEILQEEGLNLKECCDIYISRAYVQEEKIVAAVIIGEQDEDKVSLITDFIGVENEVAIAQILFEICYELYQEDDECKINIPAFDENIKKITDMIFKDQELEKEDIVIAGWSFSEAYDFI